MMLTAAGFIFFSSADQNDWVVIIGGLPIDEALCETGLLTADNANRMKFGHIFRTGEEMGQGAEWLAAKIHIKTCTYDTHSAPDQLINDIEDTFVKELRLINGDHRRIVVERVENLGGAANGQRFDALAIVRRNFIHAVSVINTRLKDLHRLAGDQGAAYTADQFFGFATKHAAAHDFKPTCMMNHACLSTTRSISAATQKERQT
jgi:hypothetical protein